MNIQFDPEQFESVYYIIYFFMSLIALAFSLKLDLKNFDHQVLGFRVASFALIAILILFAFRNENVGTDTKMYIWQFENYRNLPFSMDFLYNYLIIFLNTFSNSGVTFLFTVAFLFLFVLFLAIITYSKISTVNPFLLLFCFTSLFFFQTLGTNIIRQGVGLSCFLLGVSYFFKKRKITKECILAFFIGAGIHFTTMVPILFFLFIIFFKNLKIGYFYLLYFLCLLLSAIDISILDFSSYLSFLMVDERRSSYLSSSDQIYQIGFKPQFVVFNSVFLFLSHFCWKNLESRKYYEFLLKYYALMSAVFFMMFKIPYSDRWGVMSWVVIPFLLAPFYSSVNRSKKALLMTTFLIIVFLFFSNY